MRFSAALEWKVVHHKTKGAPTNDTNTKEAWLQREKSWSVLFQTNKHSFFKYISPKRNQSNERETAESPKCGEGNRSLGPAHRRKITPICCSSLCLLQQHSSQGWWLKWKESHVRKILILPPSLHLAPHTHTHTLFFPTLFIVVAFSFHVTIMKVASDHQLLSEQGQPN